MTPRWLRPIVISSWLGVACLLVGCGPGEVRGAKLKGQVLANGQPVKPQSGERVWVTFERAEPAAGKQVVMCAGPLQKDGTFTIEGQTKKGTPPGKYTVTLHAEYSSGERESRFAHLFPGGKSPFVTDVTDQADQSFAIDVEKKTITRQ